jgi:hypothetical protein
LLFAAAASRASFDQEPTGREIAAISLCDCRKRRAKKQNFLFELALALAFASG